MALLDEIGQLNSIAAPPDVTITDVIKAFLLDCVLMFVTEE